MGPTTTLTCEPVLVVVSPTRLNVVAAPRHAANADGRPRIADPESASTVSSELAHEFSRQLDRVRSRLVTDHPGVDRAMLDALIERERARFESARVRQFRVIFVERNVRAQLRDYHCPGPNQAEAAVGPELANSSPSADTDHH
jgi:hypothetical protein